MTRSLVGDRAATKMMHSFDLSVRVYGGLVCASIDDHWSNDVRFKVDGMQDYTRTVVQGTSPMLKNLSYPLATIRIATHPQAPWLKRTPFEGRKWRRNLIILEIVHFPALHYDVWERWCGTQQLWRLLATFCAAHEVQLSITMSPAAKKSGVHDG